MVNLTKKDLLSMSEFIENLRKRRNNAHQEYGKMKELERSLKNA